MDIKIGKFTLETLTTGMYDSPKDIYREYIQNAVDSIDNAIAEGILKPGKDCIKIKIDRSNGCITIIDNGTGVSILKAQDYLLNIGDSIKFNTSNRGFRGIGRLAGLAYCDELIFTTSYYGEETKTTIAFNALALRKSLYTIEDNGSFEEVFIRVVSISNEYENKSKHYFSVTLRGVSNSDEILDDVEVYKYLSQVAPAPFSPTFKWKDIINSKLLYRGLKVSEYNIFIESDKKIQLYKNYSDSFLADRVRKSEDKIEDIEEKVFKDNNDNLLAILWFAKTSYSGTVQNDTIKGVRLRKGNIQLGERNVLNSIFKDERFNGWLIGELHIISPNLIPNARRDNLEKTNAYYDLQGQLRIWADEISATIRKISISRNSDKTNKKLEKTIEETPAPNITIADVETIPEIIINDKQEYDDVAHAELINQLDILINKKYSCTKYNALNVQTGITIEEKKILETVLDIIQDKYPDKADGLISTIIKEYKSKDLSKR